MINLHEVTSTPYFVLCLHISQRMLPQQRAYFLFKAVVFLHVNLFFIAFSYIMPKECPRYQLRRSTHSRTVTSSKISHHYQEFRRRIRSGQLITFNPQQEQWEEWAPYASVFSSMFLFIKLIFALVLWLFHSVVQWVLQAHLCILKFLVTHPLFVLTFWILCSLRRTVPWFSQLPGNTKAHNVIAWRHHTMAVSSVVSSFWIHISIVLTLTCSVNCNKRDIFQ